jgi:hypothetical protein
VRFTPADAQTHAFPCESADAIFSRFGVMFFADPVAALPISAKRCDRTAVSRSCAGNRCP